MKGHENIGHRFFSKALEFVKTTFKTELPSAGAMIKQDENRLCSPH